MKLRSLLLLCCLCANAYGADSAGTASSPAESSPPPAPSDQQNVVVPNGAQVTITKRQDLTVEEYRVNGRLYMIKITPAHGKPYYLVDDRGDGRFARQNPLDFGIRPPQWVIKKF
jgi:hypothetical protein